MLRKLSFGDLQDIFLHPRHDHPGRVGDAYPRQSFTGGKRRRPWSNKAKRREAARAEKAAA